MFADAARVHRGTRTRTETEQRRQCGGGDGGGGCDVEVRQRNGDDECQQKRRHHYDHGRGELKNLFTESPPPNIHTSPFHHPHWRRIRDDVFYYTCRHRIQRVM